MPMNQRNRILGGVVLYLLLAGCAHLTDPRLTASGTILVEEQVQRAEMLLLAADVARSMNFPGVTRFDREKGIVDFGSFGTGSIGVTARVMVSLDKKTAKITVQRARSAFVHPADVALPLEEIVSEYTKRYKERLQQTVLTTKENLLAAVPSDSTAASPMLHPEEPLPGSPGSSDRLIVTTLPEIKVEPIAPPLPGIQPEN